ncbi:TonB-dependent receptor [Halomonas halocynthiae]|uniref:TonB-dependent receptor n=1 Tax=Halomonas halocynthiae TaxID=176290 RepID=UPI0004025D6D|nr:TonB-dependent receptor [Halomonas halocynthiae]
MTSKTTTHTIALPQFFSAAPVIRNAQSTHITLRASFALVFLAAIPSLGWAQPSTAAAPTTSTGTDEATIQSQETMVVVGSRTPKSISEIPGAVWLVDQQQLETQLATGADLKTALGRLVPGLDLAPQGRTNYGQNMRGRSVQVLIDGVSLNSSRGLSRQFDSIDPFNIERVEVLSGASSLYGGGATGGIINIVTKKSRGPGRHFSTASSVTSGLNSNDDANFRLAQSVSGGSERLQGRLAVAYQDNGRFYDGRGNEIFPDIAQTDLQDNRSIDIMGTAQLELSDEQTLTLGAQLYRSAYEGERGLYFPNLALGNLDGAEIRDGYSSDRDPKTDRRMINLQYHHADLLGQDFYFQAFYREEEASFNAFPYSTTKGVEFRTSKQDTNLGGIKALFNAELSNRVSLTYGLDMDRETFDANQMYFDIATSNASGGLTQSERDVRPRYPSYQVNGYAGFAQSDWQVTDAITLSAGVRQQHMDVKVDDFNSIPGGKNDYDATLLNASALYDYDNGHQNWIQFSQGFELPDPAKYYGKSADISVSSNPLEAIKTDQVELGWRFNNANWSTQAAVYYSWSNKAVENAKDLSVNVVNEDKRDYGLEAAVTRYLNGGFEVGGTLQLVRSEQKDRNGNWKKRDARYASLSSATAFLGWENMAASRSARLQANHAHNLKDDNDRQINGYTTVDLALAQDLGIGRLTLGIDNLLDKEYSTVWGQRAAMFYSPYYGPEYLYDYQGRGRTFTLGWTMDF